MGKEHRQRPALEAIFRLDYSHVPERGWVELIQPPNTPNQQALADAIRLGLRRVRIKGSPQVLRSDAAQSALSLFNAMEKDGHQTIGGHCEQAASDPHSNLWALAMLMILHEASAQQFPGLRDRAVKYWSDHFSLVRDFEVVGNFRCPGGRAFPGTPLQPSFTVDSFLYARFFGLPTRTLGKLFADSETTLEVLDACREDWPAIQAGMSESYKLGIPVRKWAAEDGGFTAAFVVPQRTACYQPLVWVVVDGAGKITAASSTIDDFKAPAGEPVIVGA